jgi:RNA polymerase sigma-70 factor (ECF subfamily)
MLQNSLPDEELMLAVRDGVGEQLGVLFERYHSPLFNFYCRLTGDRTISEDLVQDVFFRILKYRHTYKPGTQFRAWMYQIARNARMDSLRKSKPEVEFQPEMVKGERPADAVQQEQESELLHKALMMLPEEKREVLILSRFQELKYDEIAKLMGIEEGTVKVRVHRALQELRGVFRKLEQQGRKGPEVLGS